MACRLEPALRDALELEDWLSAFSAFPSEAYLLDPRDQTRPEFGMACEKRPVCI